MVIQSNMSPNAIVEVWAETKDVFNKYNIPLTKETVYSKYKISCQLVVKHGTACTFLWI